MKELQSNGMSDFDVKNNIQTFLARTLSLVYAEVRHARARVYKIIYFNWNRKK